MKYREPMRKPDLDVICFARNIIDGRSQEAFEKHLERLHSAKLGLTSHEPLWNHVGCGVKVII